MKITQIQSYIVENPWNPWFFVRLTTDTGLVGVGEGIGYHWSAAAQAYLNQNQEKLFLGRDPHNIEKMVMDTRQMLGIDRGLGMVERSALSAVEMACWDLLGKHYGVPVYRLLGGLVHERLRTYANGWYNDFDATDPQQWASKARRVVEMGYTALKFDPFGSAYRDLDPAQFRLAVEVVRAVREAVGLDVGLIVEAHARFHPEAAIKAANAMERFDLLWFEAPTLGYLGVDQLKEVTSRVTVPIGTDVAGISDLVQASQFLGKRSVGVYQPDVGYSCGILEVKKMAALADAMGVFFAPHQSLGPVCMAASVQVAFCSPAFYIQESFGDFAYPSWTKALVPGSVEVRDGYIEPTERPGLGIDFDTSIAEQHPLKGDRVIDLISEGWEGRSDVLHE